MRQLIGDGNCTADDWIAQAEKWSPLQNTAASASGSNSNDFTPIDSIFSQPSATTSHALDELQPSIGIPGDDGGFSSLFGDDQQNTSLTGGASSSSFANVPATSLQTQQPVIDSAIQQTINRYWWLSVVIS